MQEQDFSGDLQAQVADAIGRRQGIDIQGGGSKLFYGRSLEEGLEALDVSIHRGIENYQPSELVLTARAGTPISVVAATLSDEGQCLPFDPPQLDGRATVGGTVACGLSGPSRPYAGSLRDHVLGLQMINGRGELLNMGGEVMKNVAGYDVSRLMAGALGTLGVITKVSFKVLPEAKQSCTLVFHLDRDDALQMMIGLSGRPLPVSATCYYKDILMVRLSGSPGAVAHARETLGGEILDNAAKSWNALRDWQHPFFHGNQPLWRLALPALAVPSVEGEVLIEWGGAQWWLRTEMSAEAVRAATSKAGGHATLFRGGDRSREVFHPLDPEVAALHQRIRKAFDPLGLFNPGRQYPVDPQPVFSETAS